MMMLRGFGLMCLFMIITKVNAREFTVGGAKGWTVPSSAQVYSQWAEQSRFQVGDSLLFIYQANQDSVLQVTKDAYDSCNTDSPAAKFTDGHTSFKFSHSGPYYFISGNKDNCNKNQKLVVIVMADRSGNNNNNNTTISSSPPSPAPAPSGESAPSPPVTGTVDMTPTPTPTPQETPKNAASSPSSFIFLTSIAAILGAAVTSSLLLH